MDLSKSERAILINQYEILKRLDPESDSYYDEKIAILSDGYRIFYDEIARFEDELSIEDSRLVIDVLSMYRALESYYREHPDTPALEEYYARYKGFDGNEETDFYAFAEFLTDTQGKFQEQLDNPEFSNNSHANMLEQYRAMLEVWRGLDGKYQLTEEQVMAIVTAQ